jgi:adenylate kinase family enzyme
MRTVIVGNCGSGKTWLAKRLSEKKSTPVVHLDDIFWLPGGFNEKRDRSEVSRLIETAKSANEWIAEGIYGNLAQQFLQSASTLVWLELPWCICLQRLEFRGSESKTHMGREQSETGLLELIQWAENYSSRASSSGRAAHLALFEAFKGRRHRFCSESQVLEYLDAD